MNTATGLTIIVITIGVFAFLAVPTQVEDRFEVGGTIFSLDNTPASNDTYGYHITDTNVVVLYTTYPPTQVWRTCNHEMIHVNGKSNHDEFTWREEVGLVPHSECNEVVMRMLDKST